MNVFILDQDIEKAAQYHCDKHVVKMITEYAQILSTTCRLNGVEAGYKITHKHHPCVKWACASIDNWRYLKKLLDALHKEWKFRYDHPSDRVHKAYEIASNLPEPKLPELGITSPAQAMPDKYKHNDTVAAYRNYYIGDKQHLAKWKKRGVPNWFEVKTP